MKIIQMGHPGHFIGAWECRFRISTYVNGFIVSTVGQYRHVRDADDAPYREIGYKRLFETMVFTAKLTKNKSSCCPAEVDDLSELEMIPSQDAASATRIHYETVARYARRSPPKKSKSKVSRS